MPRAQDPRGDGRPGPRSLLDGVVYGTELFKVGGTLYPSFGRSSLGLLQFALSHKAPFDSNSLIREVLATAVSTA